MYHSFFNHLSIDGYLGCFHSLALVNNAAVNTGVHIFFQISVLGSFKYINLEVELLDHKAVPFLIFWGTSTLFSMVAAPAYVPTISPTLVSTCLVGYSHRNRCEGHLTVVLICISLIASEMEHLSLYLLGTCMFSWERVCSGPLPTV